MSAPSLDEQIAAATAYEALHVKALFETWTAPVLDAATINPGARVLDVACGTGVLARTAQAHVGTAGTVTGIDAGAGMVAVAQRLAPTINWHQGRAESLPFEDEVFDAVVSQFGLMFFTDRERAIREMLRVLVPGGSTAVAVWDTLAKTEAYAELVALFERMAGQAAADALRAPFVLGDHHALISLFERAGATEVAVSSQIGRARFPSIAVMVEAELRGWLPIVGVMLEEDLIQGILAEAEIVLRRYVTANGEVVFDMPAHIATAIKR